jgi:hypothetical protein
MEKVNFLSLVLASLVPMVVGFIYYHKALFGKAWMESIGMTDEKQKSANMPVMMAVSLVMSFLIAFFMMQFCNGAGQEGVNGEFDTFKHGALHGIIVSLFLIIPVVISNGLFEQKSWKNILINGLYWMITLAIMGGIVDAMNHFPNAGAGM